MVKIDMSKVHKNAPIGLFDSGVGGLTVFNEILKQLPNERVIYFGDTSRVPYGSKSKETIIKYCKQIVNFLLTKNVKAVVIACNTASAHSLEELQKEYDIPIVGVVIPGAKAAIASTVTKRIGVIATEGTVHSEIYAKVIHGLTPDAVVISKPCPLFVPLVEEGWTKGTATEEVVKRYLSEFEGENIDTLILGCTHFPLLRNTIKKVVGDRVKLINPAHETAKILTEQLEANNILSDTPANELKHEFYVSGNPEKFLNFCNTAAKLPFKVEKAIEVDIELF